MTNPNKVLIDLYIENRRQFARTIGLAGGNAEAILDSEAWQEVLFILTTNNIAIDAVYRGERHESNTR